VTIATTLVIGHGPSGCVARGSRCKVNDGVDVNVAVDVKVLVKVIVEDRVNLSHHGPDRRPRVENRT
jgi:hypothetical protein